MCIEMWDVDGLKQKKNMHTHNIDCVPKSTIDGLMSHQDDSQHKVLVNMVYTICATTECDNDEHFSNQYASLFLF